MRAVPARVDVSLRLVQSCSTTKQAPGLYALAL